MYQTVFLQAIQQTFPTLDKSLQEEIYQKIFAHSLEFLKNKLYTKDPHGLQRFNHMLTTESDHTSRSKKYVVGILEKCASLSMQEQTIINQELSEEITRVMHEIYKVYE